MNNPYQIFENQYIENFLLKESFPINKKKVPRGVCPTCGRGNRRHEVPVTECNELTSKDIKT